MEGDESDAQLAGDLRELSGRLAIGLPGGVRGDAAGFPDRLQRRIVLALRRHHSRGNGEPAFQHTTPRFLQAHDAEPDGIERQLNGCDAGGGSALHERAKVPWLERPGADSDAPRSCHTTSAVAGWAAGLE